MSIAATSPVSTTKVVLPVRCDSGSVAQDGDGIEDRTPAARVGKPVAHVASPSGMRVDMSAVVGQMSMSRLAELAHYGNSSATQATLVASASEKMGVPLSRFLLPEPMGGTDLQVVVEGIEAADGQIHALGDQIRQRMDESRRDNELKLEKIEQRQKELEASDQKSGCVKVLETVAAVVKAVAAVSDCGATLGVNKLVEAALSKAGGGGLQLGLAGAACSLCSPLSLGASAIEAGAGYVDRAQRETHMANGTDILADLHQLAARAVERDARNAENMDQLVELVGGRGRAVATLIRAGELEAKCEEIPDRLGRAHDHDE